MVGLIWTRIRRHLACNAALESTPLARNRLRATRPAGVCYATDWLYLRLAYTPRATPVQLARQTQTTMRPHHVLPVSRESIRQVRLSRACSVQQDTLMATPTHRHHVMPPVISVAPAHMRRVVHMGTTVAFHVLWDTPTATRTRPLRAKHASQAITRGLARLVALHAPMGLLI